MEGASSGLREDEAPRSVPSIYRIGEMQSMLPSIPATVPTLFAVVLTVAGVLLGFTIAAVLSATDGDDPFDPSMYDDGGKLRRPGGDR